MSQTTDMLKLPARELYALQRQAGWEPAKIREQAATVRTDPLFAGLTDEIYAAMTASALKYAQEIEDAGKAATAELARRAATGPRTVDLPYIA